jgi:hypothetical protein
LGKPKTGSTKLVRPTSSKHKRGANAPASAMATTTATEKGAADVTAKPQPVKVRPHSGAKAAQHSGDAAQSIHGAAEKATHTKASPRATSPGGGVASPDVAAPSATDVTLSTDLEDMNRLLNPLELKQLKQKLRQQAIEEEERAKAASVTIKEAVAAALQSVVESVHAQQLATHTHAEQHAAKAEPIALAAAVEPAAAVQEVSPAVAMSTPADFRRHSSARLDAVLMHLALETDSVITPVIEESSPTMERPSMAGGFQASESTVETAELLKEFLSEGATARRASASAAPSEPQGPTADTRLTIGETLPTVSLLGSIAEHDDRNEAAKAHSARAAGNSTPVNTLLLFL